MGGPGRTEELAEVPAKRGVFFLAGASGEPILLAEAADIRARVRFRLAPPTEEDKPTRRVHLGGVVARVCWKLADSHFETEWAFLQLARAIHPQTYRDLFRGHLPWFVRGALDDPVPALRRDRPPVGAGAVGPFRDARSAGRFVEVLQDVFGLCRCERLFPHAGVGCVYAQMGRCSAPCRDDRASRAYRALVAEALDCAAGHRGPVRQRLAEQMRRLAADQRYEQAGMVKARLERLAELDRPEFGHVAPIEQFRYVLIHRGATRRRAKVFLADTGVIKAWGQLDYPLKPRQLEAVVSATAKFGTVGMSHRAVDPESMALVCRYLFMSPQRRGVAIRDDGRLNARVLGEAIESAAATLKLSRPAPKKAPRRPKPNG
ncbi:hypothetical protein LCGC14_1558890 [marine sediment metagenome]|uniref:UVR domain-containing protein n=1 Tax=marine sediment metagenome TaxID=412755 RepID=A0A0F9IN80_9ZZZZ